MSMRVSLIVVEESDDFHHKQRNFFPAIAAQSYPRDALELIVVHRDGTPSAADAFAAFRREHPGLSASLLPCATTARAIANNLAAAHATGELLVFLADDFEPSPGLVAAHAAYHTINPDIDAVGIGPALFPDELRRDVFVRWLEDSGRVFGVPMRRAMAVWPRTFFYAGNASVKKRKFDALGGFDEHFLYDAWEDYEFGLRWVASGGYSQFIAGATATHWHAVSFEERCASMVRSGISAHVLERLHPNQHHAWRAMLRVNEAPLTAPAEAAPTHLQMAFYAEQMEEAFRRGYLSGIAERAEVPS